VAFKLASHDCSVRTVACEIGFRFFCTEILSWHGPYYSSWQMLYPTPLKHLFIVRKVDHLFQRCLRHFLLRQSFVVSKQFIVLDETKVKSCLILYLRLTLPFYLPRSLREFYMYRLLCPILLHKVNRFTQIFWSPTGLKTKPNVRNQCLGRRSS
jgi:hypothetical protein